ncbi:hypothetical protein [Paraburkholderia sp. J41]|uniref:hypothetical protein n=1 Tax=Paraburkholderia sp. J41 TaxID=2805433 RepID=UPI002AC3156E|nr:hypothetical protein [Paraburkholderia sp. J41]
MIFASVSLFLRWLKMPCYFKKYFRLKLKKRLSEKFELHLVSKALDPCGLAPIRHPALPTIFVFQALSGVSRWVDQLTRISISRGKGKNPCLHRKWIIDSIRRSLILIGPPFRFEMQ